MVTNCLNAWTNARWQPYRSSFVVRLNVSNCVLYRFACAFVNACAGHTVFISGQLHVAECWLQKLLTETTTVNSLLKRFAREFVVFEKHFVKNKRTNYFFIVANRNEHPAFSLVFLARRQAQCDCVDASNQGTVARSRQPQVGSGTKHRVWIQNI